MVVNDLDAHAAIPWSEISSLHLRAELVRRQEADERPSCGSNSIGSAYNTHLHIVALVIILLTSSFACSVPLIVRHFPRLPVPRRFLFLSRHFGTGVLIATAFVHLIPTAFVSLTDPCLPPFWNEDYPAMAGLVAMVAILVVVGIEMVFATRGASVHGSEYDTYGTCRTKGKEEPDKNYIGENSCVTPAIMLHDIENSALNTANSTDIPKNEEANRSIPNDETVENSLESSIKIGDRQHKKLLLQCLLLEAGILFHSIFIGMALGVSVGSAFIVLLIAIAFHQTFEGLALGSRIAALGFPRRSPKPWLMAVAYGTTTPIGQAIGIGLHHMYDPDSEVGLLTVGLTNAVSSGLLVFAGLVELLADDLLSEHSYEMLKGRKRIEASAAVVVGAALMSLVGGWA